MLWIWARSLVTLRQYERVSRGNGLQGPRASETSAHTKRWGRASEWTDGVSGTENAAHARTQLIGGARLSSPALEARWANEVGKRDSSTKGTDQKLVFRPRCIGKSPYSFFFFVSFFIFSFQYNLPIQIYC